jgi:hypothetical protein
VSYPVCRRRYAQRCRECLLSAVIRTKLASAIRLKTQGYYKWRESMGASVAGPRNQNDRRAFALDKTFRDAIRAISGSKDRKLPQFFDRVFAECNFGMYVFHCWSPATWTAALERREHDPYLLPNGNIVFQSSFMFMTFQPAAGAASSASSSLPTEDLRS